MDHKRILILIVQMQIIGSPNDKSVTKPPSSDPKVYDCVFLAQPRDSSDPEQGSNVAKPQAPEIV